MPASSTDLANGLAAQLRAAKARLLAKAALSAAARTTAETGTQMADQTE